MKKINQFDAALNRTELQTLLRLIGEKVDPALLNLLLKQGRGFLESVGSSENRPAATGERWQDRIIAGEVRDGASILDLGCGEGNLLSWLQREKNARVQGVEIDADQVAICVEKGIPVIQTDLDLGLRGFPDKCFEYVILEETLQTLKRPDVILDEMLRVGHRGIVTFPNFGYWRVRLDLAVRGRMPVTEWLPHRWFETPNIHLFSISDFIEHANAIKMRIIGIHVHGDGESRPFREGDNLYAEEAVVIFE
ncbi:MAG: methionine biosynthesis protein MetW [Planctomycetota bacterium]|jgi:methionine biosynthesis protein MetW|nr:methionine biosynthesis protein MetW [Planctomycetota bacterium]